MLLSLGVSHTNELEASEALAYLRRWVLSHPKHAAAAAAVPPNEDSSQAARHVVRRWRGWWGWGRGGERGGWLEAGGDGASLAGARPRPPPLCPNAPPLRHQPTTLPPQAALFEAAARAHPEDGEVYSALGVVLNLARQYDEAVEAFRCALRAGWVEAGAGAAGQGSTCRGRSSTD